MNREICENFHRRYIILAYMYSGRFFIHIVIQYMQSIVWSYVVYVITDSMVYCIMNLAAVLMIIKQFNDCWSCRIYAWARAKHFGCPPVILSVCYPGIAL